jgi:Sterol-sensing domain of SREBP cleavage-activation
MPAVRNFALCAALAIFLDFLLQVRCNRGCRRLLSVGLRSCLAAIPQVDSCPLFTCRQMLFCTLVAGMAHQHGSGVILPHHVDR